MKDQKNGRSLTLPLTPSREWEGGRLHRTESVEPPASDIVELREPGDDVTEVGREPLHAELHEPEAHRRGEDHGHDEAVRDALNVEIAVRPRVVASEAGTEEPPSRRSSQLGRRELRESGGVSVLTRHRDDSTGSVEDVGDDDPVRDQSLVDGRSHLLVGVHPSTLPGPRPKGSGRRDETRRGSARAERDAKRLA